MSTIKVAMIVGSSRPTSLNERLARAIEKLALTNLISERIRIDDLSFSDSDLEKAPPPEVVRIKADVARNAAALFVMPEFNRSIPAMLKNAIDIGSRSMADNFWRDMPGAMTGTSPGAIGTAAGQQHLRQVLSVLGANALPGEAYVGFSSPTLIDPEGTVENEATRAFIKAHVDRFAVFVDRFL